MASSQRVMIACVLIAGACTPAAQPPAEPAQETQVATPLPVADTGSPIAVAKAQDLPAAQTGGVTVDGWGAVRIGMTLDQLNAALGEKLSVEGDDMYEEYACTYLYPRGAPKGLSVMFTQGVVTRIDVDDPGVATYGGLQVGDTSARAKDVLGGALNTEPHFYLGRPAEYLTLWTAGGPKPTRDWPWTEAEIAAARSARGVRFETTIDGVIDGFYAGSDAIELVEGCL